MSADQQFERMFMAACSDLGAISESLGLDPNDGGADPILDAIEELRAEKQATLQRLQAMNAELEAEAQMKRDAARYRWLRSECNCAYDESESVQLVITAQLPSVRTMRFNRDPDSKYQKAINAELDAAVDEAMAAPKEQ